MEEEVKRKYLELQMTAEQMKQMQSQLQVIEGKLNELQASMESIDELKGKKDSELLTPIADGIFLKTVLKDTDEVIMNVGAGICINKTLDESKQLLMERHTEIKQYAQELLQQLENTAASIKKMEEDLEKMINQKNV